MKIHRTVTIITAFLLLVSFSFHRQMPDLPKIWTTERINSLFLPLADSTTKVSMPTEDYYYKQRERVIYKSYPMYMPGREPKGYFDWLRKQEPEIVFNAETIKTEADYLNAGEIVYDAATGFKPIDSLFLSNTSFWKKHWEQMGVKTDPKGIIPQLSVVVKKKGEILLGILSCGNCHSKVMPDGEVLKGGQGDFPFDQDNAAGFLYDSEIRKTPDSIVVKDIAFLNRMLFAAPWIKHPAHAAIEQMNLKEYMAASYSVPEGVITRHGSLLNAYPTAIPDLFNIKDRKYLDHTGLVKNRDIYDLMLYATLNQESDFLVGFNDFYAVKPGADPAKGKVSRFTDLQLLTLAKFIYTLRPPENPNKASEALAQQGKKIFAEEGCDICHSPPHYSSNKLIPVTGFKPPAAHFALYDIDTIAVDTDPGLSLYTRRATGYYKVPSLIGVWNRTALQHSGYITSLEELFNKARLRDDYTPKGFKPTNVKTMAVKGHEFGLDLTATDKAALIAFLRSL
ncbi:MAG: hypothetical protein V4717_00595 [Bacteroidota bacterium]